LILLTAMPVSRNPGAVPTVPVVRTLAALLVDRGEHVRVLAPAAEGAPWPEAVDVHAGRVTDAGAFARAAAGAERVFLAGLVGEPLDGLRRIASALVAGGTRRAVVLGSHGADFEDAISEETWQWSAFDRVLGANGVSVLHLRPTAVMANASCGGYPITGSLAVASLRAGEPIHEYLPHAPYAFIHEDDLAEAAAALLLDDRHEGTLDVSGTTVTAAERVAELNRALGLDGVITEIDAATAAERWRRDGWPEATIGVMLYALPAFAASPDNPALRAQEETLRRLIGHPPRTFAQWADARVGPPPTR